MTMAARTQLTCMPAGVIEKEHMMRCENQLQRVWSPALVHTITEPVIAIAMGVSGFGKATVSTLLAAALGCQFQEGDDLHSHENVAKIQGGTPLTDADRLPWLRKIAEEIDDWRGLGESGVLACSALKRSYRDIIIDGCPDVSLVYLKGSYDLIRRRVAARHEHFMPLALLNSQFATLQEPTSQEHAIVVDVGSPRAEIATEIVQQLQHRHDSDNRIESRSSAVGCEPRSRMDGDKPFTTDGGNYIIDCVIAEIPPHPAVLEARLSVIIGVAESGLFIGLASKVIVGRSTGVEVIDR